MEGMPSSSEAAAPTPNFVGMRPPIPTRKIHRQQRSRLRISSDPNIVAPIRRPREYPARNSSRYAPELTQHSRLLWSYIWAWTAILLMVLLITFKILALLGSFKPNWTDMAIATFHVPQGSQTLGYFGVWMDSRPVTAGFVYDLQQRYADSVTIFLSLISVLLGFIGCLALLVFIYQSQRNPVRSMAGQTQLFIEYDFVTWFALSAVPLLTLAFILAIAALIDFGIRFHSVEEIASSHQSKADRGVWVLLLEVAVVVCMLLLWLLACSLLYTRWRLFRRCKDRLIGAEANSTTPSSIPADSFGVAERTGDGALRHKGKQRQAFAGKERVIGPGTKDNRLSYSEMIKAPSWNIDASQEGASGAYKYAGMMQDKQNMGSDLYENRNPELQPEPPPSQGANVGSQRPPAIEEVQELFATCLEQLESKMRKIDALIQASPEAANADPSHEDGETEHNKERLCIDVYRTLTRCVAIVDKHDLHDQAPKLNEIAGTIRERLAQLSLDEGTVPATIWPLVQDARRQFEEDEKILRQVANKKAKKGVSKWFW